jgi:FkbM family methyltransferase
MDTFGYKTDGYFVEVGAFDGVQWSNTSGLVDIGWHGVYFEPQTRFWGKLMNNHGGKPGITLIKKAISNFQGQAKLYVAGSVSTIKEEVRDVYSDIEGFAHTGIRYGRYEWVPVNTLDNELARLDVPRPFDVLVIDVEGAEYDVLEGFSIDYYKPRLAIIEAHEQFHDERLSSKATDINNYMTLSGYKCIHSDEINNVYVLE